MGWDCPGPGGAGLLGLGRAACRRRAEALGARVRDEDGAAPVLAALDRLDG